MNRRVLGASKRRQVLGSVVHRISVDVVDYFLQGSRPVGRFIGQHGAQLPNVRLGNLHPCARSIRTVVPLPDANAAHRYVVVWQRPGVKLSGRTPTPADVHVVESVVGLGGTPRRAVVDGEPFSRLSMEGGRTDGTNEGRQQRLDSKPTCKRGAPSRAGYAFGGSRQTVGPHVDQLGAMDTGCLHGQSLPMTGTDTTVPVAMFGGAA